MWLRILGSIKELCTALNACLNIIIYRYLNSPGLFRCHPKCHFSCCRGTTTVEVPTLLPMMNIGHVNTSIQEHESRHLSENATRTDDVGSSSIIIHNHACNPKQYDESRNVSNCVVNVDVVSEIVTFQVRRKGHDYI